MTTVARGIIVVSSSYSMHELVNSRSRAGNLAGPELLAFFAIFTVNRKVEIGAVSKTALDNDVSLQFEDRDARSIELNSSGLFLGFEFEKD